MKLFYGGNQANVVAHIAGSAGSGKTTLGNRISNTYPNILVKDLDDINNEIQGSDKFKNMTDIKVKDQYYTNKFTNIMNKFITDNRNKEIVFVGYNSNWNSWIDIPTKNLFFIDLPINQIIEQRYARYPEKQAVPNDDIIQWIKETEDDIMEYHKHNYDFLEPTKIYEKITQLLYHDKQTFDTILADTKKYLNITDTINIIGMGEATHGQNLINEFRINIFKFLVKKFGYTTFVLEDQYSNCELINQWIHNNSVHELKYLFWSLMFPWQSVAMYNLIKWMKKFNKINNNVLDFRGIDVQRVNLKYDNPNDEIAAYAKKISIELTELYNNPTTTETEEDEEMVGFELRDESMFNLFMKFYQPNKKYFLFAHNGHLEKGFYIKPYKNLGYHLDKHFKDKYLVIGNSFNGNSYRLGNPLTDKIETAYFDEPIDLNKVQIYDSKNKKFELVNVDPQFKLSDGLTMKNDDDNFEKKYIVEAGSADAINPYKYLTMSQIDNRYDAVVQIPNEYPIVRKIFLENKKKLY